MANRKLWTAMLALALVLAMAAVSCNKGSKTAKSGGGMTWTVVKDSAFGKSNIRAIAWGKDKFVAAGEDGRMLYSTGK